MKAAYHALLAAMTFGILCLPLRMRMLSQASGSYATRSSLTAPLTATKYIRCFTVSLRIKVFTSKKKSSWLLNQQRCAPSYHWLSPLNVRLTNSPSRIPSSMAPSPRSSTIDNPSSSSTRHDRNTYSAPFSVRSQVGALRSVLALHGLYHLYRLHVHEVRHFAIHTLLCGGYELPPPLRGRHFTQGILSTASRHDHDFAFL
jgi:hypothetical protein